MLHTISAPPLLEETFRVPGCVGHCYVEQGRTLAQACDYERDLDYAFSQFTTGVELLYYM